VTDRTVQHLSDGDLYRLASLGDREAVRRIVERYHGKLVAYGRASGWGHAEVQDAVQIAWMSFFRMIDRVRRDGSGGLRDPDRLGAWLVATVRNALHDEYRKAKRRAALSERAAAMADPDGVAAEPDFLAGIEVEEQRSLVRRAFRRLGQTCRDLLSLLLVSPPLAYVDIAEAMGKPIGSIGPNRQRCIEQVRSLIAETA
jgi:RNA polymerase sigma factor (sigma-70 family)